MDERRIDLYRGLVTNANDEEHNNDAYGGSDDPRSSRSDVITAQLIAATYGTKNLKASPTHIKIYMNIVNCECECEYKQSFCHRHTQIVPVVGLNVRRRAFNI